MASTCGLAEDGLHLPPGVLVPTACYVILGKCLTLSVPICEMWIARTQCLSLSLQAEWKLGSWICVQNPARYSRGGPWWEGTPGLGLAVHQDNPVPWMLPGWWGHASLLGSSWVVPAPPGPERGCGWSSLWDGGRARRSAPHQQQPELQESQAPWPLAEAVSLRGHL